MLQTIKDIIGASRKTQYEKDSIVRRNIIASVYMAVIVVVLELWMVWSLTNHILHSDKVRTPQWLFEHYAPYVLLIICSVIMLVYAYRYFKHKHEVTGALSRILIFIYSVICLGFGIRVGVSSFADGDQVFGFLTMVIFVCCLYVW